MADSFESVREEYQHSLEAYQAAATAIEEFDPEAKGEDGEPVIDLESLEATFDNAEAEFESAKDKLELFERTQEARKIAIPEFKGEGEIRVKKEPLTYERGNGNSIFRDMLRRDKGDFAASARLERHMEEVRVEQPEKYDLSSTDSAGGYLVAPLYLQDEFAALSRAGRAVTDAIGTRSLPPNTDSINIPKLATGVTVANQADGGAVSETDATFGTVASDVKTIAGMQDVSQQLVDRSVPGVDEVIFADLVGAYHVSLDTAVINSSTSNNEGILQADSTNTTTYTDATPTVGELYPKIADAIQEIHSTRYMPPDAIFMHPRRWAWFLAALDSSNRPLVVPSAQVPQNAVAGFGGVVSEGYVGTLQGLPVFVDANIPTTNGAGTNEDAIAIVRRADLFVWEDQSGPYLETFRDVGSGTLTVRFRLHNYWAQQHERTPESISLISGSGLAAPTF